MTGTPRQGSGQAKEQWIDWECPECDFPNLDNYKETTLPMCGGCMREIDWEDILRHQRKVTP